MIAGVIMLVSSLGAAGAAAFWTERQRWEERYKGGHRLAAHSLLQRWAEAVEARVNSRRSGR